jgi:ABC-2 type transport system permease protein
MMAAAHQVGFIARRSLRKVLRQPALVVPSLVFPLFLMALNSGGLDAATKIPGFPTDNYLNFALALTFMQGALFAAVNAGTELATDIQNGFLNRLQLTPLRGVAVLIGQLTGALALGAISAAGYLLVGLAAGAHLEAGIAGVPVLFALAMLTALGLGAIGSAMAAASGSAEAVQGLFPLLFVLLFLSSSSLPRDLIDIDWFRTVTTYNPFSYLIEGMRSLIITGWDGTALWRGFLTAAGISALGLALAARGLRTRMGRT